jgi:hypothetical protein
VGDPVGGRVVAVLGYSSRRRTDLHPICAERLSHAQQLAEGASAVVLSGWARHPHGSAEAHLMQAAWDGPEVPLVCDPDSRTTAENAASVAAAADSLGAAELVVVTSRWHRRRAGILLRAALGDRPVRLTVTSPAGDRSALLGLRELGCYAALPLHLRHARRGRKAPASGLRPGSAEPRPF